MNDSPYFWEVKDLLTQFLAAFDDTIIKRYDKNRNALESIEVRYVLAPKQRVMYDIINKAQNITLPVVAVDIASISRDSSRVFGKLEPTYLESAQYGPKAIKVPAPVPINIVVNMSILTRYMSDMDQIISNFVPYANPYIILSWQLPQSYKLAYTTEVRSEVLWNETLTYSTPTDTTYSDKFRVVVDTSFTIKGWLFRDTNKISIIYKIDANFYNIGFEKKILTLDSLNSLSAINIASDFSETVTISAVPIITNLLYTNSNNTKPIYEPISIDKKKKHNFIIYGKRFSYNNNFYLSSGSTNFYTNFKSISTAKSPLISAYALNANQFTVVSDNIATITLAASTLSASIGSFTFVTANSAGWANTSNGYALSVV